MTLIPAIAFNARRGFCWRTSSPRILGFVALGRVLARSVHPSTDGHRAIASACPVRGTTGRLAADMRSVHQHAVVTGWATPTVAAPTAAPPTTARRVVRRATAATLTGVPGRPTRACALLADNERPWLCDQSTEPKTPQTTTAAIRNVCFKPSLICSEGQFCGSNAIRNPPVFDLRRWERDGISRATSVHGSFRTSRNSRHMSASLIGPSGSSAFRLSTNAVSM